MAPLPTLLTSTISKLLPRPAPRYGAIVPRRPVERVIVFARLPNPTFDYYCAARMAAPGMPSSQVVDIRGDMPSPADASGAFIIICRYLSGAALRWIENNEGQLAGVAYFTDDDVSTFVLSHDAKPGYRFFLFSLAIWPLRRLNRVLDMLYVSTPALAEVFAEAKPVLLPPAPPTSVFESLDSSGSRPSRLTIVFHAKAVHDTEHAFLAPILREVLRRRPNIALEISGDERSLSHWKGFPAVTIVPEIPWPDYVKKTGRIGADIVLVPLLDSPANANRSDTKRIDVARMGAAGIFSTSRAYGEADSSDELIVPNDAALWTDAILSLIDDERRRAKAAAATRIKVEAMARRAAAGFPLLTIPVPGS